VIQWAIMAVVVFQVSSDYLPVAWSRVARSLAHERSRPALETDQLYRLLRLGERTLWLVVRSDPTRYLAAFTTGLVATGKQRKQTLLVHLLTGHAIEAWADQAALRVGALIALAPGIDQVHVYARKGWMKSITHFKNLSAEFEIPVTFHRDRPTKARPTGRNRVPNEIGACHVSQ
jgi:hypothetical protein